MSQTLVIVESPAKAKTIEKFLGKGHKVLASYGHVRALPSKQGSVDVEHDFLPKYQVLAESKKHIEALRKEAKKSDHLILATDLDREGEAIAWHLLEALGIDEQGAAPEVSRVVFHEITRSAIEKAMAEPRKISRELVDAQQTRSILDYLVGFNLSPFLWKKIRYGLSAGRVQSVALRLICEREKEIEAFKSQEYWSIEAALKNSKGDDFTARLARVDGATLDKLEITGEAQAMELVAALRECSYRVAALTRSEKKRNPAPPFITSTLQQEASRKLGFSARKTMSTAQRLYEGVDIGDGSVGLITYMRTDSVVLSKEATDEARAVITQMYGAEYALAKPRNFRSKAKNAQEAHEAIRPTSIANTPEKVKRHLSPDQFRLYSLIWKRTVASQMAAAVLDATSVDIAAGERFMLRASGQIVRFPGFMMVYIEGTDDSSEDDKKEGLLPVLEENEALALAELLPEQHFTQPPPRYSEARLVKTLEEYGIGRPSTYASIINTLLTRKYVRLEKKAFHPEDVGRVVNDMLTSHFSEYVDYDFTAGLEETLDAISRGEKQWKKELHKFWDPFKALIDKNSEEVQKGKGEEIGRDCPECGQALVKKLGRSGFFIACSGFPTCRHTEPLAGDDQPEPEMSDQTCDKCGAPMLIKTGRYGKFLACSAYPGCKNIQPLNKPKSLGIACPTCNEGELQEKKSRYGKIFYSCNRYPKCKYALWDPPREEACPQCSWPLTVVKTTKRYGTVQKCPQDECSYEKVLVAPEKKATSGTAAKKKPAKKAPASKK